MDGGNPISLLMFFTLVSGVVIGAAAFIYFLRRRSNQYAAEHALLGTENHRPGLAPDGALPELVGILVIALVVMALLAIGYIGAR